ncbi:MAG: TonB-dependent receptor plug domain-containing protein [Pseudohongiella sp.]|nr:TonB-dependent receptor plug domain-containing protein [Pseudohongiella sp.]
MTRRFKISPFFSASTLVVAISSITNGLSLANAEEPEPIESHNATVIYPASFFQPYNPVSVNDMVDRIPGVSINGGGGGRGLGSGGNLLINGQRLAGKDNSPRAQLSRIPAKEVERIEIIRDPSGEHAVRGSNQVVNIILQEVDTRSSTSVEVSSDFHREDGTLTPGLSLSHNQQTGNFSSIFNLQADPQYRVEHREENSYAPDLTPTEQMLETNVRDKTHFQTSVTLGYRLNQHRMQLNALAGSSEHPVDVDRRYLSIGSIGAAGSSLKGERERVDYSLGNWEVGGDYEYSFGNGSRALFVFIVNDESNNNIRERFELETPLLSDAEQKMQYVESNSRTRERIAQTSYNWSLTESQDVQVGIERAQTILDSSLFIGRTSGSTEPSPAFGGLRPAWSISNPGSSVEEMRYEGFAVHNWAFNDRMSLESSLVYETSDITQTGNLTKSRDFNFWRPTLDYRFNITSALQVKATVGKEVQQLSFANFSATANNSDKDQDVNAGNPDLLPTEEVRYEVGLEYRLPDDAGVLSSRFFVRELTNTIGRIDATTNPAQPLSAAGNIGDGKRWGMYLDGSTRLGQLGLPDATLTSSLHLFDSKIINPILGTEERINGRGRAGLGFRHDVTDLNLNYGLNYNHPFNGGNRNIEISTIEWYNEAPQLSLFVSKVMFDDVTFRLESNNTLGEENCRNRVRYNGSSASGNIREVEDACWGGGQTLALKVRTTF